VARLDPTHLAVLYFDDQSEGGAMGAVARGLTEDLIDLLGQVEALSVTSANGVRPYRDRPAPVDSIARALSVGTIVTGTVTGSAEHPRVTVRLIDAATGRQLVSTVVEPAGGDVLTLRADLALEVSRVLRERLGREFSLREVSAGTRSSRAWVLLRRAGGLRDDARTLYAGGDTSVAHRTLDAADSLLGAAERLDPSWLDPIVLRGWLAADRIDLAEGKTFLSLAQWAAPGIAHAERALARKPDHPPALELRGYLRFMRWDYSSRAPRSEIEAAERDLRAAAVPENPSQARAWAALSLLLQRKGSFAEANLAAQRAYQADAFLTAAPTVVFRLFYTSVMLRRWREAADWCAQGYHRFPTNWLFSLCRLVLLYEPSGQRPDGAQAWRLLEEMERVAPPSERAVLAHQWRMLVATVLARAGQHDSARSTIRAARNAGMGDPELDFYEAGVRVLLGEHEQAVRLLERYIARTPAGVIAHVKRDPLFDALQGNPRFQALVADPP
jgi:serine/threonine-protein kinase